MYHLKDFDVYCKVATKIRLGRIHHLCQNEKMCLNGMIRKPRATYKRSLQGLFQHQNADGHVSFVTKFMVDINTQVSQCPTLFTRATYIQFSLFCIRCKGYLGQHAGQHEVEPQREQFWVLG